MKVVKDYTALLGLADFELTERVIYSDGEVPSGAVTNAEIRIPDRFKCKLESYCSNNNITSHTEHFIGNLFMRYLHEAIKTNPDISALRELKSFEWLKVYSYSLGDTASESFYLVEKEDGFIYFGINYEVINLKPTWTTN